MNLTRGFDQRGRAIGGGVSVKCRSHRGEENSDIGEMQSRGGEMEELCDARE